MKVDEDPDMRLTCGLTPNGKVALILAINRAGLRELRRGIKPKLTVPRDTIFYRTNPDLQCVETVEDFIIAAFESSPAMDAALDNARMRLLRAQRRTAIHAPGEVSDEDLSR